MHAEGADATEVWKRRCFDGAEVVWRPVNDVESLGALANQVTTISCASNMQFWRHA